MSPSHDFTLFLIRLILTGALPALVILIHILWILLRKLPQKSSLLLVYLFLGLSCVINIVTEVILYLYRHQPLTIRNAPLLDLIKRGDQAVEIFFLILALLTMLSKWTFSVAALLQSTLVEAKMAKKSTRNLICGPGMIFINTASLALALCYLASKPMMKSEFASHIFLFLASFIWLLVLLHLLVQCCLLPRLLDLSGGWMVGHKLKQLMVIGAMTILCAVMVFGFATMDWQSWWSWMDVVVEAIFYIMALSPFGVIGVTSPPFRKTPSGWQLKVGLELHIRLKTFNKLFSPARNVFSPLPNLHVHPFDAAYPGTLPVLNQQCLRQALKAILALDGIPSSSCNFDRKHYAYPDLPAGYQITQKFNPLGRNGKVVIPSQGEGTREISILQFQLEQDTGKTLDFGDYLGIDLNRAGTALLEIVTAPQLRSAKEASSLVGHIQEKLKKIDCFDGNAHQGALRCDVNVSLFNNQQETPRVEIKNVNGLRNLELAIQYEQDRLLSKILEKQALIEETRTFNPDKKKTIFSRLKETNAEYCFLPDGNIPDILISQHLIQELKVELDTATSVVVAVNRDKYNELTPEQVNLLEKTKGAPEYFEKVFLYKRLDKWGQTLAICNDPITIYHCMMTDMRGWNKRRAIRLGCEDDFDHCPVSPLLLANFLNALKSGKLDKAQVKTQLLDIYKKENISNFTPPVKQEEEGEMVDLTSLCEQILRDNPGAIAQIQSGQVRVMHWLVGQVAKKLPKTQAVKHGDIQQYLHSLIK